MSRFFVGLALWALLLALAACGGDSKGTDPARDTELAEMVDTVVSTFEDLTVCTDKREGSTAYVEDEKKAYVCDGDDWTEDGSLTNEIQSDSEKKASNGKSSSSGKNNPSSPVASPCKTETEDNCEYGTLTDDRDGQTYKIVKIGEQWWMAENLNYAYTDVPFKYSSYTSDSTSWCYDNDAANCAKYGRLYTWAAAMDSVGTWSTNGMGCGYYMCSPTNPVRGICPEGWHLPDITEWNALFNAVGGKRTAGIMLKSTEGWKDNGNGSDAYSFSALPAGYRYSDGNFSDEGNYANFWSSMELNSINAYGIYLYYDYDNESLGNNYKYNGFSVRCLKDYGPDSEKMSSNDKSSSSEKNSSSSSIVSSNSSSSSVVPTVSVASPCKNEAGDNCEYGTLTDDRDGQTYKTVKIGEQWWMAENLNYAYTGVPFKVYDFASDSTSWCCDNDAANCAKYGRLYTWSAAMDSVGEWSTNGKGCGYGPTCSPTYSVRGVCPEGWHLPDTTEWHALFTAVGGKGTAGKMLKSTEGWNDYEGTSGNGLDKYVFSALSAGRRYYDGDYGNEGYNTLFWSSTEGNSYFAYYMYLGYYYDDAGLDDVDKNYGFSVRCLMD